MTIQTPPKSAESDTPSKRAIETAQAIIAELTQDWVGPAYNLEHVLAHIIQRELSTARYNTMTEAAEIVANISTLSNTDRAIGLSDAKNAILSARDKKGGGV